MGFGSFGRRELELIASFDAPLAAASSVPTPVLRRQQLREFAAALATPGTTDTTVQVLRNGAPVATLTIPADDTFASVDLDPPVVFAEGDTRQVQVPSAGTGASRLGVGGRFT